jgi:hypothetical protein
MLQHANAIIHEDQHITTRQLVLSLSISRGSVSHIIRDIGYLKLCMIWVPWSLTVEQKIEGKAISYELLACFEAERETFLSWIVTAHET